MSHMHTANNLCDISMLHYNEESVLITKIYKVGRPLKDVWSVIWKRSIKKSLWKLDFVFIAADQ